MSADPLMTPQIEPPPAQVPDPAAVPELPQDLPAPPGPPEAPTHPDQEIEAYARCLASETSKQDAWPLICIALRNAAAARRISVYTLLRRVHGVDVGWGRNADGHFASTSHPPTMASLFFATRFVHGEIADPPGSEGIRSFYETDEHGTTHDPSAFLHRNPELELAAEVDGWQFYRRHNNA